MEMNWLYGLKKSVRQLGDKTENWPEPLIIWVVVGLLVVVLFGCTTPPQVKPACPQPPANLLVRPQPLQTLSSQEPSSKTTAPATITSGSSTP